MPSVDDKPRSGKTDEHYAPEATESRTACMHSTMLCLPVLVSFVRMHCFLFCSCLLIASAGGMAWCRSF